MGFDGPLGQPGDSFNGVWFKFYAHLSLNIIILTASWWKMS